MILKGNKDREARFVGLRPAICAGGALLFGALFGAPLSAQETIASDRPGLGSGSAVLGHGIIQMETGAEYAGGGRTEVYSLGQGLFRYGLLEGVEIQGLLNSLTFVRGPNRDRNGLQDMGFGVKLKLPTSQERLSLSFLSTLLLPTGSNQISAGEAVPNAVLLADLPLSDRVNLSGNLGFSAFLADAENQVALIITPSVALPSEVPMAVYGGYAGFYSDSEAVHYAEGGVTWLPSPSLQFDLNGGFELDSGSYFIGIGVATRWRVR